MIATETILEKLKEEIDYLEAETGPGTKIDTEIGIGVEKIPEIGPEIVEIGILTKKRNLRKIMAKKEEGKGLEREIDLTLLTTLVTVIK